MSIIYFDNFRGFTPTFLPLKEINFFVGENSTGKSSVLKLIGILSSPGFWRYNIFGEEETAFGTFSEIKTSGSGKDFFEIGLLGNKPNSSNTAAFKLRFIEKNSFPSLKEICYRDENINVQATIDGSILKYRFLPLNGAGHIPIDSDEFFKSWIDDNGLKDQAFYRLVIDNVALEQILFQLNNAINTELKNSGQLYLFDSVKIAIPDLYNKMAWFAPSVAKPAKVYEKVPLVFDPEGQHSASVLQDIIAESNVRTIIDRFGLDSGLFESIAIKPLAKVEEDSFEVQLFINGKTLNIANVGYGVSQILPLIIEAIARPNESWIVSQQPETHLHPKAQAALGDFIFKSNQVDQQKFILETHSDYIIDRFRLRVNRAFTENPESNAKLGQVVFFSKSTNGNLMDLLEIRTDGAYGDKQPAGFRDFFLNEQFELIKI